MAWAKRGYAALARLGFWSAKTPGTGLVVVVLIGPVPSLTASRMVSDLYLAVD